MDGGRQGQKEEENLHGEPRFERVASESRFLPAWRSAQSTVMCQQKVAWSLGLIGGRKWKTKAPDHRSRDNSECPRCSALHDLTPILEPTLGHSVLVGQRPGATCIFKGLRLRLTQIRHAGGAMKGINFVTNTRGRKTAVLIDLKRHGQLWEDFYDSVVVRNRAREPRESLDAVKERLRRLGKLRG